MEEKMVNKELEEHITVKLTMNKRTYNIITGLFAEKNMWVL